MHGLRQVAVSRHRARPPPSRGQAGGTTTSPDECRATLQGASRGCRRVPGDPALVISGPGLRSARSPPLARVLALLVSCAPGPGWRAPGVQRFGYALPPERLLRQGRTPSFLSRGAFYAAAPRGTGALSGFLRHSSPAVLPWRTPAVLHAARSPAACMPSVTARPTIFGGLCDRPVPGTRAGADGLTVMDWRRLRCRLPPLLLGLTKIS